MDLNINLDYKRKAADVEKLSNGEITLDYIQFAVKGAHPAGLSGTQRRMFGRIQRKFEAAVEEKSDSVNLDQSEFDFIKSAFSNDKVLFDASLSKFVVVLEDEIDRLSKL